MWHLLHNFYRVAIILNFYYDWKQV